ncbi:hypothetical protein QTP88_019279 [Uroleucon formosanum]
MFAKDLCNTFLLANTPLEKLENKHVRLFLEKYTSKDIPSVSLLRKTYVNECYEDTMNNIQNQVKGKKIWVSIDETTDATGRYIANVAIGTLEIDKPGKIFLLSCDVLEKDAAPYMVKAANAIKAFYSKMIHLTCIAHGLHRTSEKIRSLFPKVDELIANMKKVFLKAPARVELFKKEAPDVPLPPSPIITRWGTWLEAAINYCEYFKPILNIVQQLSAEDAISIGKVKKIMFEENILEADLVFIYSNYGILKTTIKSLEKQCLSLADSIKIVENIENKFKEVSCTKGVEIYNKFKNVIEKNDGFRQLSNISKIITGENTSTKNIPEDLSSSDLVYFKYAPISSTDVERSFSRFKNIFAEN